MYESELKGEVSSRGHLRRSAGFGRARLNASLAMRAGSQNRRPVLGNDWRGRELCGRAVPCRSARHVLARPAPACPPAGAGSLSPGDHLRTDTGGEWNSRHRARVCSSWAIEEESNMPVLLLWAVPAVIVVGGVGYYLVRAVH